MVMPEMSGPMGFSGSLGPFGPMGPVLPARVVQLRPVTAADLPELVQEGSGFDYFGPRSLRTEPHPASLFDTGGMAVCSGGSVVGCVTWMWLQRGPTDASRNPMIGIWIQPAVRRRGIGTEAQRLVVEEFFRHTAVHRVEAHTEVANIPEQRALENAGFVREGTLRKSLWREGEFRDVYVFAVLREEWESAASLT